MPDTAAQRAVKTSAALGLRICGISLSELLVQQIAQETEVHRVVSAYQVPSSRCHEGDALHSRARSASQSAASNRSRTSLTSPFPFLG